MTAMPSPPVNVRVVCADETEFPVDTVYTGQSRDGMHQWEIVNAPPKQIVRMKIQELPPGTTVVLDARLA